MIQADVTVPIGFDDEAYHAFLRSAKMFWSRRMYGALRREFAAHGLDGAQVDDAERAMRGTLGYQFFGWFERNLQRQKYRSRRGIIALVDRGRERLTLLLDQVAAEGRRSGRLSLDPDLAIPRYYSETEFHQHPGGVGVDPLAGVAYEIGRRTTMPLHLDPFAMHDAVAAAIPDDDYARILDLGCGTGRSTLPLKRRFSTAEVHGIDLSAPCLKMAYLNAEQQQLDIRWSQQNVEQTAFEAGSFDLIHSTFLLHEMPPRAVEAVVAEAARLLRPGGQFVHLDFHSPPGGTWGRFIYFGHARRNDEVFMRSFSESDFKGLQQRQGFKDIRIENFDDGTGAFEADDIPPVWRFPFQLLSARKA